MTHHFNKKLLVLTLFICCPALSSTIAQIRIMNARVTEAPPGMAMSAGYLEIVNETPSPVTLVNVSSKDYSRIEIHRSFIEGGVARMKRIKSVSIPAQSKLEFRPGDYHLMLFEPRTAFRAGDIARLLFNFSEGTSIETDVIISSVKNR